MVVSKPWQYTREAQTCFTYILACVENSIFHLKPNTGMFGLNNTKLPIFKDHFYYGTLYVGASLY